MNKTYKIRLNKHPGGRPLKFKSPKELQEQVDEYFKKADENKEPYLITGLALHLDTFRSVLLDYENGKYKDEFANIIKKAKQRVESFAERKLYAGQVVAGPIFALKNFGWKDRTEVDNNIKGDIKVNLVSYDDSDKHSSKLQSKKLSNSVSKGSGESD